MEHPAAAEALRGPTVIPGLGPDDSVLILIQHCRDMKQQESRLRLITLLLLLSCSALFVFTFCADLWQRGNSGSSGHQIAAEQSPAYLKQEGGCPADSQTNIQKLRIHLESLPADDVEVGNIRWHANIGEKHLKEEKFFVIPEAGIYFVYVRIALSCHDEGEATDFHVKLHRWNAGYNETMTLAAARDGLNCTSEGFRTVFVGQLFDLWKGDHMSVWIEEGFKLITKSYFGAYLA